MLQDEISKLGEYFRGIEYFNDALIVKVVFPARWQVYPSNDGLIKPAAGESNGEYFYYGDTNNVSLDDIFGLINETITANNDAEMKVKLLTDKYNELKELFRTNSYEKLLSMKFVLDDNEIKIEKPKRKYTKRKKKEEETKKEEEENIIENENNDD